jgi:hypothetical protein
MLVYPEWVDFSNIVNEYYNMQYFLFMVNL